MTKDHNQLIAAAAKKALGPLGMRRDGKSRLWYDDRGWWTIVVEFQPSGWSRGSYLNVGVCWLLYEQSHWSFDVGGREQAFQPATDEAQFEAAMEATATQAATLVTQYRERYSSLDRMYAHYRNLAVRAGWPDYHAGIIAGLSGNVALAEQHLAAVMEQPCEVAWQHGLRLRSQDLRRLLPDHDAFRDSVLGIVLRSRSAHGLAERSISDLAIP